MMFNTTVTALMIVDNIRFLGKTRNYDDSFIEISIFVSGEKPL
jgi:hypothetical protein